MLKRAHALLDENLEDTDELSFEQTLIRNFVKRELELYRLKNVVLSKEQKLLRRNILTWVLEIVSKRRKTLSTFDKAVNLFDRVC